MLQSKQKSKYFVNCKFSYFASYVLKFGGVMPKSPWGGFTSSFFNGLCHAWTIFEQLMTKENCDLTTLMCIKIPYCGFLLFHIHWQGKGERFRSPITTYFFDDINWGFGISIYLKKVSINDLGLEILIKNCVPSTTHRYAMHTLCSYRA